MLVHPPSHIHPPFRYLSVCSGIEAATVAWEPLGWQVAGVSEIDTFPCHVLHHRIGASRPMFLPDPDRAADLRERSRRRALIKGASLIPEHGRIPNFGDLEAYRSWPRADVSLLVGGTPCQSFSVAGLRKGLDDPRGNLALVFLGLVDLLRPDWVVWENVPGVLSSSGGRDFGAFLGGLGQLGYGFAYRVLDAQYVRTRRFAGAVPQRRRRVFVVGYLGDWRPAAAVLFDRESLLGNPPPRRIAGQGAAAGTLRRTDGGSDVDHARALHLIPEVCNAIAARDYKQPRAEDNVGIIPVAHALRAEGFDASEDGTGRGTPLVPVAGAICRDTFSGGAGGRPEGAVAGHFVPVAFDCKASQPQAQEDGAAPTLRAMGHAASHPNAGGQIAIAFDAQAGGETGLAVGDVAGALHGGGKSGGRAAVATPFTIMERGREGGSSLEYRQDGTSNAILTPNGGRGGLGVGSIALPWAVRRLTPMECERLQGFPDGYTDVPYGRRNWTPDGPRYKALGNSMAVNVMGWIGERIELVRGILAEQGR